MAILQRLVHRISDGYCRRLIAGGSRFRRNVVDGTGLFVYGERNNYRPNDRRLQSRRNALYDCRVSANHHIIVSEQRGDCK